MATLTDEALADLIQARAKAIIGAVGSTAGDDMRAIFTPLGVVVGCFSAATATPEEALAHVIGVARGIMSGELLDPARVP
jgi:hypothetical protein